MNWGPQAVAVEGKEFRITVDDDIPVALADEMLGKFLKREIKFRRFVSDFGLDRVKNAHPSYIGKRRGVDVITFFEKDGLSGFEYEFSGIRKPVPLRLQGSG